MASAWTNITDAIFDHARAKPTAVALVEGPTALTFLAFADLIARTSVWLTQQKIKSGDHVGVRMTNSADHLILSLALLRIGAVKFELSPNHTPKQLEAITRKFSFSTLFVEPPMKTYRGARAIPIDINWRAEIQQCDGDVRHDDTSGDPWFANLTSGSTGESKGVVIHHSQMIARYREYLAGYGNTGILSEKDPPTVLMVGSMSFAGFHAFLLYQILSGAKVVVLPEFSRFYDIVRNFSYYDDAVAMIMPDLCSVFLSCVQKGALLFPRIRALVSGGQPLAPESKRAMLTGVTAHYHELYGTSSAGWVSVLHPEDMARRSESVGRPVPGMEVEIVDGEGNPLPANTVGRLRLRSATTSYNYVVPEETGEEGYRDGWFYPGDLAMFDSSRFLHLKGRVGDIITRNGVEIYPAEVEALLRVHASVSEVVVVGLPTRQGGREVVALVVAKGEPQHEDLVQHCKTSLPAEKRPGALAYTDALPRTANGKIDRGKVAEQALRAIRRTQSRARTAGRA
ncbi:class I adenylate-forming enzyme family protein [Emcibacter sp. SYSU 3D8]|uniref:class I adenylate-forming enzyme family protein n=1 Tax=Emcibacter sp. SYSU 3D8 TaxID=3133969 RepID=UPI0031FF083F